MCIRDSIINSSTLFITFSCSVATSEDELASQYRPHSIIANTKMFDPIVRRRYALNNDMVLLYIFIFCFFVKFFLQRFSRQFCVCIQLIHHSSQHSFTSCSLRIRSLSPVIFLRCSRHFFVPSRIVIGLFAVEACGSNHK